MQTGGYTEQLTTAESVSRERPSGLQTLNVARLGAQYTHLFNGNIEVNVSGGGRLRFRRRRSGATSTLPTSVPIAPGALPNTTWFEYGARVGYRVNNNMVVDAFVLGTAGGAVGATVHGGLALRLAF